MDWKNVIERGFKTFVEAFVPALVVALSNMDWSEVFTSENGWKLLLAGLFSAAATGISVVWNGV